MAKRRFTPKGSSANIRFDLFMTDYEWLALRDFALSLDWTKTRTIIEALKRFSEEAMGYDLFTLYENQTRSQGAPPPASGQRRRLQKDFV